MTDTIKVQSARDDARVALWERHPDHPFGEVFVAGAGVVEVACTAAVINALAKGEIVEVESKPAPKPAASTSKSTTTSRSKTTAAKADADE